MADDQLNQETLARVDERTKSIQNELSQLRGDLKSSAEDITEKIRETERRTVIRIENLEHGASEIFTILDREYVKKAEFGPIKIVVYGFVGLLLTAIITAMITAAIHQNPLNKPEVVQSFKNEQQTK